MTRLCDLRFLDAFFILIIMTQKEVWRDIPGYEGYYQASDLGRVRSLDRTVVYKNGHKSFYKGKAIKGYINKDGYKNIGISKNGIQKILTLPQIIAITFLGHIPNGSTLVVDHRNGNKLDDRLENLRIVTHRKNLSTCFRKDRENLSSQYTGVSWKSRDSRWIAQIITNGVNVHLGSFHTEIEAHHAYQNALKTKI